MTHGAKRSQPNTTTRTEMAPAYRPADVEPRVYERWLAADVFAPDGAGSRADQSQPPFVITQPPPNVTGALHTGHALTTTVEDMMIRHARMQGRPTLWVPGVDHASIAAQVVLDRILATEGESRASLGRERYLDRMWQFINATRDVIGDQHRRLGASVDWGRLRFTMDEGSARAVRVAFKRLHDDGLAYRGEQLINWCPGDRTSLSDLEVIGTPTTGTLWSVRYHYLRDDGTPDPDETITVATTRPETILGDTAVAVHPDDERYRAAIGRRVLIPFVERVVPVIADPVVKPEFGTGAVKITPAHDAEDFAAGQRHGLPMIDVMTDDGRINERGGPYAGLTTEDARARIVADLEARGDLAAAVAHEMVIGRCERSGDVVEPRLKVQWFINVKPMAEKAMAAVNEGRATFVPPRYTKVFFDWLENIHDWNVSRQLWWGHRIPAWYCPDGHISVSDLEHGPTACEACGRPATELVQEEDIFDTWFSSGLWPFSTLGWPDHTPDFARYYPTSVMETGYEIIFFWVARMMMLGEWLTGREPFHTVYLHGMVRDPYGAKMSKTKGNVVDPLGVVEEMGADALRFALVHGSDPTADQKMSTTRLEGARNFANKLWNAARFVLGARPTDTAVTGALELPPANLLGPAEHWILARCAATVDAVEAAYAAYAFGETSRLLFDAIWSEYCDWYLELAKVTLGDRAQPAERRTATWTVLVWVLDRYLRLLHPLMPFVTEEIWSRLPRRAGDAPLLIVSPWPVPADAAYAADTETAAAAESLIGLVHEVRTARAAAGVPAGEWLPARLWLEEPAARRAYAELESALARLARIRPSLAASRDELSAGATADELSVVVGAGEARLARSGADLARERDRLKRELEAARAQLGRAEAELADPNFVARAPATVVDGARRRAAELRERAARLAERAGD
jgi:valyl-tRNA synthetase